MADVKANLEHAKYLGVRFVDFTGGEPLLHNDLPAMLEIAKQYGLHTSVTTNTALYPSRAQELAGKIDFLHFSLDASSAHIHDRLRNAPLFESVLHSIDIARKIGESPDLLFTVCHETLGNLPPLALLAQKLRLVLIVNPVFSFSKNQALCEDDLLFIEHFSSYPYVYVNKAFHTLRRQGGNNISKPRCRAVNSTIVISPDNYLLLPCFHFHQTRIKLHNNLADIWHKGRYRNLFPPQGRLPACAGCVINCYFDPSFCYKIDKLFFQSLAAKLKYARDKYILRNYHLWTHQIDTRTTKQIVNEVNKIAIKVAP